MDPILPELLGLTITNDSNRHKALSFERGSPDSLTDSEKTPTQPHSQRRLEKRAGRVQDTVDFARVLPPEIVSLIFVYACQPTPDPSTASSSSSPLDEPNPRWRRRFFPLWLGRVCRLWRHVAWCASELWTTIVLRIAASQEKVDVQTDLLREWLDRAHERPLDIYVEEYPRVANRNRSTVGRNGRGNAQREYGVDINADFLLALLFSRAQQWRTIDFHLPQKRYRFISFLATNDVLVEPDWGEDLVSNSTTRTSESLGPPSYSTRKPKTDVPSLKRLQTASLHDSENVTRSDLPLNLSQSRFLRDLSFSHMVMKPGLLRNYPTNRITRLTLSNALQIVPRHLFSQFPALEELTLVRYTIVGILALNAASLSPVTHENLRVLHIHAETEFMFNMLVHQLALPALTSLHLCVPGRMSHKNFLPMFLQRCSALCDCGRLTRLTLEPSISSAVTRDLIRFLSSDIISSSLRELCILNHDTLPPYRIPLKALLHSMEKSGPLAHGLDAEFFERFHPHAYPRFLPRLEKFEYRGLLATRTEEIDFLEGFILRSRMRELPVESDLDCSIDRMAIMRKVSIRADHVSGMPMSIAEYPDVKYVWEVIRMVEEGVFSLLDGDGVPWM